jgi:lipoate-protein ligase A
LGQNGWMKLPLAANWIYRHDGSDSGEVNMAKDLELLDSPVPVLRLYAWSQPTISLGYSQKLTEAEELRFASLGLPVVRRPTGGRTLLHDVSEITYAMALPEAVAVSLSETYQLFTSWLHRALVQLGIPAELAKRDQRASSFGHLGCYGTVQTGEILLKGRKLIGSAQRRNGHAVLQHGAIPGIVNQELLEQAMPGHVEVQGLHQLGYFLTAEQLLEALRASF